MKARLAALALGGVLALVAGELGARALLFARGGTTTDRGGYSGEWTVHDELLGWRPRPGARVRHRTTGFDVAIEIDERGFRAGAPADRTGESRAVPAGTADKPRPPRPGAAARVVLLGDSFVFGEGVEGHEAWPARLAAARPDLDVVAMGVPGWGTDQMLLAYRELAGPHRAADVVVLAWLPEHVERNVSRARHGHAKPWFELDSAENALVLRGVPVPARAAGGASARGRDDGDGDGDGDGDADADADGGSRTEVTAEDGAVGARDGGPARARLGGARAWLRRHSRLWRLAARHLGPLVRRGDPYPEYAADGPAWRLSQALLAELAREVRARGAELVVAIVPEPWHARVGDATHQRAVAESCAELDVPSLDLTPAFRAAGGALYRAGDGHWTSAGHGLAARELERFLAERALVAPR